MDDDHYDPFEFERKWTNEDTNHKMMAEIDAIAGKLDSADSSYRRARRLHRLIQKRYLLHYDAEADGIATILLDGRYNCLSATMLYGLAARAAGLDARVLEIPGHLLLRLRLPGSEDQQCLIDVRSENLLFRDRSGHLSRNRGLTGEDGMDNAVGLIGTSAGGNPVTHNRGQAGLFPE